MSAIRGGLIVGLFMSLSVSAYANDPLHELEMNLKAKFSGVGELSPGLVAVSQTSEGKASVAPVGPAADSASDATSAGG